MSHSFYSKTLSRPLHSTIAGIVGNFLEHYDSALFGLLAPFIAPLFFNNKDPVTALILTYGMLPLGFITRPLGSLFFGWIGDLFGRRQALFLSLSGMALVTTGMGCLPIYEEIGILAPLLLALGRMLQSFFAAGEVTGGALFVLEQVPRSKRGFVSSCFDASSIGGILVASGLVTLLSAVGLIEQHWRTLFWAGGFTAVMGIFLRLKSVESDEFTYRPHLQQSPLKALKKHKTALLSIILASGFSYTTYSLACTFMNGYVPLITSLSKSEAVKMNTALLIVDLCLLPCFGYLANKFGKERVMLIGALSAVIMAIPLFSLLEQASLTTVVIVRLTIITCGVAFAAPYYAWAMEQAPIHCRYLIVAFGGTLGSQLIGVPSSAICLWLHKTVGWSAAPGIYLSLVGGGASFAIYRAGKAKPPKSVESTLNI